MEYIDHRTSHACTGPEDQASAMAMITEAAVAYDKTSPASFSLGAFEGATMTPLVFKEQLRRYDFPIPAGLGRAYPLRKRHVELEGTWKSGRRTAKLRNLDFNLTAEAPTISRGEDHT